MDAHDRHAYCYINITIVLEEFSTFCEISVNLNPKIWKNLLCFWIEVSSPFLYRSNVFNSFTRVKIFEIKKKAQKNQFVVSQKWPNLNAFKINERWKFCISISEHFQMTLRCMFWTYLRWFNSRPFWDRFEMDLRFFCDRFFPQICLKSISNPSRNYLKTISKLSQTHLKTILKTSQNHLNVSNPFQNHLKNILKTISNSS